MWQDFVESSNIEWIGYKPAESELFVGFLSGSVYVYHGVPDSVATDFRRASSKGGFHHRSIRGCYDYDRID